MKADVLTPSITAITYAPKMENKRATQVERRIRDTWDVEARGLLPIMKME
jgi:hypothetical protein